jgi:hypothetical protein
LNSVFSLFSVVLCTFWVGHAGAADFNGRLEFTHFDLQGDVDVTCFERGEIKRAYHQCSGYLLNPGAYAHFYHNSSAPADRVTVSTVHKNGKIVQKRSAWDQEKRRSNDAFNLWVWTVFQRPLLELGANVVSFELTRNGRSLEKGEMTVQVRDGGLRQCRYRRITTGNASMCNSSAAACSEYFDLENNCVY